MSDAVLAAIIAATATLCASFLQLRVALAREADARSRGQPISRRRSRLPMILVGIMLLASAVGGFALSQWLGSSQRSAQADLLRELRDRMTELSVTVSALQRLQAGAASAASTADPEAAGAAAGDAAAALPATSTPAAAATTPQIPASTAAPAAIVPLATTAAATTPMVAQAPTP